MKASLIQGLNEKDMQAVVNTYNLNPFYFPTLFPLKFNPTLTIKALVADQGIPIVADVVSFNSSAPKKTRQVVKRYTGDIPKIEISRVKEETDLNDYFQLLHYANTTNGAKAILDWIYDDTQFCWDGVNARLEWLALQALSTGKIKLDNTNNVGVVTETDIDFLVPSTSQSGVTVKWASGNAATMDPITVIRTAVKAAKARGFKLNYIFTDQDTFDVMCLSDKLAKYCASWVIKATNLQAAPTVAEVNAALKANNLPTFVVIDSYVTIELTDGTRTSVNPWKTGVLTFTPGLVVGNTYHAPLADELVGSSAATKVKREHVMLKKYSLEEPSVMEVTKGLANAFPAWASAQQSYMVDTLHTGWLVDA